MCILSLSSFFFALPRERILLVIRSKETHIGEKSNLDRDETDSNVNGNGVDDLELLERLAVKDRPSKSD